MKRNILSLILILFFSSAFATKHNHTDENEIRYYKANPLDVTVQQQLREGSAWQSFLEEHPNWFVIFNENNKMPHRAFGEPIALTGNSTSEVLSFISSTSFILPADLRLASTIRNEKYVNLNLTQFYNNLKVIDSRVYAKLSLDNRLLAFGLDIYNDIDISSIATISEISAMTAAQQNINYQVTDLDIQKELKILPIPNSGKFKYHLVYTVKFKTRIDEGPAYYICYVDANDGTLLMRKNEVMYEAPSTGTSTVSGEVYPTNPYNPTITQNFKYLKAIDQSTSTNYYTDNNGDVVLPMNIGTQVRYKLEGLYANVETNASTPDILQNLATTNSIVFNNSNSTIQERTAYYAVNMIHDHLKTVFPTFTGLDSPMETNVDEFGSCNAFYNGSSINFYAEDADCNATAKIVDVVYHEYGHAINGNRYGAFGMQNGGLNEGFADLWAITLTESPVLGFGWDTQDPTVSVRRYDQDRKMYPQDLVGEVHADGEIIAGAFWDTYLNLGSMNQMIDLFKYTFDGAPDGPNGNEGEIYTDVLIEVLYADDNDADLTNGTPNDLAIIEAFALHGITLISNAEIYHTPVASANGNSIISINANIQLTYPWFLGNTDCYYRVNTDTNWVSLAMTQSGSNHTAQIPAQSEGNIIAYYIALKDSYGFQSGVTPFSADKSPFHFANVPYFVLVGYEKKLEEDFDFSVGNWQTSHSSDNATTGFWDIGDPIGSYGTPGDVNTIVQTADQHTTGGSQCAYTGNASSSSASIGENDVDDGHTTLISPYYDMRDYTDPAFSYWRWFTNNTGAEPNADWWQVSITDDGTNWTVIENNLTSDNSWRRFVFRAKDYVSLSSNEVQLKFVASDSANGALSGGSLVEAAVDDLYLWDLASTTEVSDLNSANSLLKLVRITDILGREVDLNNIDKETTLFYIYDDGSVEKRIVVQGYR